jgi:hypothetical protein
MDAVLPTTTSASASRDRPDVLQPHKQGRGSSTSDAKEDRPAGDGYRNSGGGGSRSSSARRRSAAAVGGSDDDRPYDGGGSGSGGGGGGSSSAVARSSSRSAGNSASASASRAAGAGAPRYNVFHCKTQSVKTLTTLLPCMRGDGKDQARLVVLRMARALGAAGCWCWRCAGAALRVLLTVILAGAWFWCCLLTFLNLLRPPSRLCVACVRE